MVRTVPNLTEDGSSRGRPAANAAESWSAFIAAFRGTESRLTDPWREVFAPLRNGTVDDLVAVGQLGQSLDGRIATHSGHSKYINGPDGLDHLHRLRALVDAVVIGVGTAVADDPQLTVRRVAGAHPARVILDPQGRIPATSRVFAEDGARRLVVTAEGAPCMLPAAVEVLRLPAAGRQFAPSAVLAALAEHGLRRVLIEGGAETVSRFLVAGCLDRLHVLVAPMILGAGRACLNLPPIERADQAMRMPVRSFQLGSDLLLDCDLSAWRVCVGRAKAST
jgi:riboflavin-specific deaminase-like protein